MTTALVLARPGFHEAGPTMAALLACGGLGAVVAYKLVLVLVGSVVAVIAWRALPRIGLAMVVLADLLILAAVANNALGSSWRISVRHARNGR